MESGRESYLRVLANLAGVLAAVLAIGAILIWGSPSTSPKPSPVAKVVAPPPPTVAPVAKPVVAEQPKPKAKPPAPRKTPELDRAAVARAEAELDALSRERARAEARAEELAKNLANAALKAAADSQRLKSLAFKVQDPSARIGRATSRGGFLREWRSEVVPPVRSPPVNEPRIFLETRSIATPESMTE